MFAIPLGSPTKVRLGREFPDLMWIRPYYSIHFHLDFLVVESVVLELDDFSDGLAVDDLLHRLYCCHVMILIVMIVVKRLVLYQYHAREREREAKYIQYTQTTCNSKHNHSYRC